MMQIDFRFLNSHESRSFELFYINQCNMTKYDVWFLMEYLKIWEQAKNDQRRRRP